MKYEIKNPIHIIGYSRSGTTLLVRILRSHPDLTVIGEPRHIWISGNERKSDDRFTEEDVTPHVARTINRKFARLLEDGNGGRLCEKTPSNCLRIPFLRALYPDSKIIHITRDGRDVLRSQMQVEKNPASRYILKRARQIPLRQIPGSVMQFYRSIFRRYVLGKNTSYWGPKPPGWEDLLSMPQHIRIAHQWATCMEILGSDLERVGPSGCLEFRYEDLKRQPEALIRKMFDFLDLRSDDQLISETVAKVDSKRNRWQHSLESRIIGEAEVVMKPMLEKYGYEVAS